MTRWLPLALLLAPALAAQGAPGTDIFIASLRRAGNGFSVGEPVNFTARAGYDNQPFFAPDGRSLLYTSERDGQTDIFRYEIAAGSTRQVTRTPENEYSPTPMPDGRRFSVVRDTAQLLWAFGPDGVPDRALLGAIKPIGYHAWLNADTVFVFVLGDPATLRRAVLPGGTAEIVARDIGRGLARVPGSRRISYVQRDSSGLVIRLLDPGSGESRRHAPLPAGNEFFAWTAAGELFSASGNRLLLWREATAAWEEIARFSDPGLQQLSRIAISPAGDRIALVGAEPGRQR